MFVINILQKEIDNIKFTIKKYFAEFIVVEYCIEVKGMYTFYEY